MYLSLTANPLLALLLIFCSVYPLIACASSEENKKGQLQDLLIEEQDFQNLAKLMRIKKLPLLLELHADHCSYCKQLEDEFLRPMLKASSYDGQIIIRQLKIDSEDKIIDFQGEKVLGSQLAARYKAYLTPTMIFLNADGEEVAERIIGINTPSLFGGYIDIEIKKALNNVRAKKSLAKRDNKGEGGIKPTLLSY